MSVTELRAAIGDAAATDATDHDLQPFLKAADGDVSQASVRYKAAQSSRAGYQKLTIADVAAFYRAPSGDRTNPDGCLLLLEDAAGGCCRDNRGRPILASLGMQHGSAVEMQQQFAYISERLEAHKQPDAPVHGACVVIEVRPRDAGAPPTFRFPDRSVRTLFDMQRDIYPASLSSHNHFCGLPRTVTWAFKLVRPFMRREAYESLVLKPSFGHLPGVMPRSSMLTQWGGELDFDIDKWVEWRAREEGVAAEALCPRGGGRRFDPKAAAAAAEEAMADSLGAGGGGSVNAKALLAGEFGSATGGGTPQPPRRHGTVEKRGSGRGLFGTVRWKPKLLVVAADVGLVYFDSLEPTTSNVAARIVPLGEPGTRAESRGGTGGARSRAGYLVGGGGDAGATSAAESHQFALVSPAREYLFRVPTAESAAAWVAALQAEIAAAQKAREEMLRADEGMSLEALSAPSTAVALD